MISAWTLGLGIALAQPVIERAPGRRIALNNGAVAHVERVSADRFAMALRFDTEGLEESPETHGRRHAFEQLVAKGVGGNVDAVLEANGTRLTAETSRDALTIVVEGPPQQIGLGFGALAQILRGGVFSSEQIALEAAILDQELAILPERLRLTNAIWDAAFGPEGIDPFGRSEVFGSLTTDDLVTERDRLFVGNRVSFALVGPIDVDLNAAIAEDMLLDLPSGEPAPRGSRTLAAAGTPIERIADLSCRATPVSSLAGDDLYEALAVGFAIQASIRGAVMTYTPSMRSALVTICAPGRRLDEIDAWEPGMWAERYVVGAAATIGWANGWVGSPSRRAQLRATLLRETLAPRIEEIPRRAAEVSLSDFLASTDRFSAPQAFVVVGG